MSQESMFTSICERVCAGEAIETSPAPRKVAERLRWRFYAYKRRLPQGSQELLRAERVIVMLTVGEQGSFVTFSLPQPDPARQLLEEAVTKGASNA